jgi:glucose-1-phosphate cytidylyltransferase
MKIFILCGGFGTRLDHESKFIAKPMVRIGNEPILYHLIENFYAQGFDEFVLCLGYRAETIVNYFIKEKSKHIRILQKTKKYTKILFKNTKIKINVSLIDTGIKTGTGGRIKIAFKTLKLDEDFLMTYGDGLSNVPIKKLIKFHYKNNSLVTMTAVKPKQRYGILEIKKNRVNFFDNSKKKVDVYINGGFHVIDKLCLKYIKNKKIFWEKEPISKILKIKKLFAFKHDGFWKSLDTQKDKVDFNKIYKQKKLNWRFKN